MEGERQGEKHQCVVASHVSPTGDLAHNPGICPDWESNQQPFGLQAGTQSSELHQPGLGFVIFDCHNLGKIVAFEKSLSQLHYQIPCQML